MGLELALMEDMQPLASLVEAQGFVLRPMKLTADFGGTRKTGSQKQEKHMISIQEPMFEMSMLAVLGHRLEEL